MSKKIFIVALAILALTILLSSSVLAAVQQHGGGAEGFEIMRPDVEKVEINTNYSFHFHMFNKYDGNPVLDENVRCNFALHDEDGTHINERQNISANSCNCFRIDLVENNFTKAGHKFVSFHCNGTTTEEDAIGGTYQTVRRGGYIVVGFDVVESLGEDDYPAYSLILGYIAVIGLLFLIMIQFKGREGYEPVGYLLLFVNLFVSIMMFNCITLISGAWADNFTFSALPGSIETNLSVTLAVLIITAVFVLLYFIIMFIKSAFEGVDKKRRGDFDED